MSTTSRWLPIGFVGLGAVLVIAAIALLLFFKTGNEPASTPIPLQVGGLSIASEATGSAALREFSQLHGQSFPVLNGSRASYGAGNQVTIWVAETAAVSTTRQLLEAMRDKIAEGNSPFQPTGSRQEGGRTIYVLNGMGQKHFYFQSGKYLIWLASNPEMAEEALQQVLNFYN